MNSPSTPTRSPRLLSGVLLVVASAVALVIGAWHGASPTSVDRADEGSLFVQSGGAAADTAAGLPATAHASAHEIAATRF